MGDIDAVSQIIGKLEAGFEAMRSRQTELHKENSERLDKLETTVDGLVQYRWKLAGVMFAAGGLVEGLHLFLSLKGVK